MSWSIYCGGGAGDRLPQDGRPSVSLITTAEDDEEGTSERLVQEGVEKRVQPWIDVAQPQESRPQLSWHRVVYERVHYVCDKEGSPAQAEAPHDDAQGLGSFGLSLHAVCAVLVRVVLPAVGGGPCALQHLDLAGMLPGRDVDAVVGQHHQEEGNVEGHHGAGNGIWLVDHEYAVSGIGSLVELPLLNLEQGEEGQGQRRKEIQYCFSCTNNMLAGHFTSCLFSFPSPVCGTCLTHCCLSCLCSPYGLSGRASPQLCKTSPCCSTGILEHASSWTMKISCRTVKSQLQHSKGT